jgi:hypothetical protein
VARNTRAGVPAPPRGPQADEHGAYGADRALQLRSACCRARVRARALREPDAARRARAAALSQLRFRRADEGGRAGAVLFEPAHARRARRQLAPGAQDRTARRRPRAGAASAPARRAALRARPALQPRSGPQLDLRPRARSPRRRSRSQALERALALKVERTRWTRKRPKKAEIEASALRPVRDEDDGDDEPDDETDVDAT